MFKSTFTTLGRIVIILAVAALIIAGTSALTSSTSDTSSTTGQPPAFDGNMPTRPDREEGGASAFGLLELVKNIGVTGLIITAYWFIQKWTNQIKRTSRLAV